MKQKKKKIINWIKAHKTELILSGVSIVSLIAAVLLCKNAKEIEQLFNTTTKTKSIEHVKLPQSINSDALKTIEPIEVAKKTFEVSEFVRNLPDGWNASAKKLEEAATKGIELKVGQTLVDAYVKGREAA